MLVLAVTVATWWVVGDLSLDEPDLDYAFRPLPLSPRAEQVAGIAAVALVILGSARLARRGSGLRRDPRWLTVLLPLVAVALLVGWGWRVLTAGVFGANIGAGFLLLFGVPLLVAALAGTLVRAVWLLTRGRRR